MRRIFHGIEMIQIAKELVEAVDGWQELILVAQMVLAKLASGIAHGLEDRGDGHGLSRASDGSARLADGGHSRAERKLTGDEVRAARRATRLGVIVGGQHTCIRELV